MSELHSTPESSLAFEKRLAHSRRKLLESKAHIQYLEFELSQITNSLSWRITKPLRGAKSFLILFVSRALNFKKLKIPFFNLSVNNELRYEFELNQNIDLSIDDLLLLLPREGLSNLTSKIPKVSVVVPIFGKIEYTLNLLISIINFPPSCDFELIIVNDRSPDSSAEILNKVRGITLINSEINQGFIASCNAGANVATGEYLVFLNNDTQITTGWLESLLETYIDHQNVGIVGSKLIYPNGKLQEAGGFLFSNGQAGNYGRLGDPRSPEFNFVRRVDYCSGASIMIKRDLFISLGGFCVEYAPAYYEDVDLSTKLLESGYKVLYQPFSMVVHFEGVSSGKEVTSGTKKFQLINQEIFTKKWCKGLNENYYDPSVPLNFVIERQYRGNVLVIDEDIPDPCRDAGSLLIINLIRLLVQMGYLITFVTDAEVSPESSHVKYLQKLGVKVLYQPYVNGVRDEIIKEGARYDVCFLIRALVASKYIQLLRTYAVNARVIFHTIDLHYIRLLRQAELSGSSQELVEAFSMQSREIGAITCSDISVVVSTIEKEILENDAPLQKVFVFPLILDMSDSIVGLKNRQDIVFVGSFSHSPNLDAIRFFIQEVFPLVKQKLPSIRLHIIGSGPSHQIMDLESDSVIIRGYVQDLPAALADFRLSIAPLRFGAGIKGKIASAMSLGLPTVATSIAIEGMGLSNGENILVADNPEQFAREIERLYLDDGLWSRLSLNGFETAKLKWGHDAALGNLKNLLVEAGVVV